MRRDLHNSHKCLCFAPELCPLFKAQKGHRLHASSSPNSLKLAMICRAAFPEEEATWDRLLSSKALKNRSLQTALRHRSTFFPEYEASEGISSPLAMAFAVSTGRMAGFSELMT